MKNPLCQDARPLQHHADPRQGVPRHPRAAGAPGARRAGHRGLDLPGQRDEHEQAPTSATARPSRRSSAACATRSAADACRARSRVRPGHRRVRSPASSSRRSTRRPAHLRLRGRASTGPHHAGSAASSPQDIGHQGAVLLRDPPAHEVHDKAATRARRRSRRPAPSPAGWCYVDPAQRRQAIECHIVAKCPATDRRIIRFVERGPASREPAPPPSSCARRRRSPRRAASDAAARSLRR